MVFVRTHSQRRNGTLCRIQCHLRHWPITRKPYAKNKTIRQTVAVETERTGAS